MKLIKLLLIVPVLLILSPHTCYSITKKRSLEFEAGLSYDRLSKDYDDWKSSYLEVKKKAGEGLFLYGSAREVKRYGITENEFMAGAVLPLGEKVTAAFDAAFGPEGVVLPKHSYNVNIGWTLGKGWAAQTGLRKREYENSDIILANISLENYFSNYRASFSILPSQVDSSHNSMSYNVRMDRYYGEGNFTGLSFSVGEEVENIPGSGTARSDISSLVFLGRHWFSDLWGLSYQIWAHRQGDYYERHGLRSGFRFRF